MSARSRSMLVRRELAASGLEEAVVLAIHGHGGSVDQLTSLCGSLGPEVSALLPQAWRPLTVHGVAEPVHPGYSWYFSFDPTRPEPATFGDCLIELECLVYDLFEENEQRSLFVLGYGQGATLALTLARVATEFISGVIAIGGAVPRIKGWSPPVDRLDGLPILMIPDAEPMEAALTEGSAALLRALGARVEIQEVTAGVHDPSACAAPIRDWIKNRRRPPPDADKRAGCVA